MERLLDNKDLQEVKQTLLDAGFNKTDWEDLGGELGLEKRTMEEIEANKGNIKARFIECLSKWLDRADQVDERHGKPTMKSLAAALTKMKKKNEAEYIRSMFEGNSSEGNSSEGNSSEGNSSEGKKPAKRQKTDSETSAGNKDGGAKARASDEEPDTGPTPQQGPPVWPNDDETIKCVIQSREFKEDLVQGIQILLMPATTSEEDPVVHYMKQSSKKLIETYIDGLRIYIGHYGESKVIVVMTAPSKSRQGPIHAAAITSKMLGKVPDIKYVVAVGVCFGMHQEKQKLGDVIISSTICDFTNKREGVGQNEYHRGPQHSVKQAILNKFRPNHGFKMPHNITVSTGVLISTGSLIDNPDVKQELLESKRDAIAGEMEGAGIMAAIDYAPENVSAIVIKGIGDWGDGDKESTKKWKPFAARAAALYVYAALNDWQLE